MLTFSERRVQAQGDIRKHGIDCVHIEFPAPGIPLCYKVNVEVTKGRFQALDYYYVTDPAELPHLWDWLRTVRIFGYDLETSAIDPFDGNIATIQVGNPDCGSPRAYVIDVRCVLAAGGPRVLDPLWAALADPKQMVLGQNLKFECKWTKHHFGAELWGCWDTQVTEQSLRAGLWNYTPPKPGVVAKKAAVRGTGENSRAALKHTSMDALTKRHLGIVVDKDTELRTSFYSTPAGCHGLRQIVYAASDVVYPFYIAKAQKTLAEDRKLFSTLKVEMGAIPEIANMELNGVRVDIAAWRALWQEAIRDRAVAENLLDKMMLDLQGDLFGGSENANVRPIYTGGRKPVPLNYSSSAQVQWAIRQYCAAKAWPIKLITTLKQLQEAKNEWGRDWLDRQLARGEDKTESDIPDWVIPEDRYCVLLKADKDTLILAKCRGQLPPEIVDALLDYSKADIRCDTFGNDWLRKNVRGDTGCVHTEFFQCVTATGRLSSSPNLQNIPNDQRYRRCFLPKPGYLLVIGDYATEEPRITAQASKDPNYLRTFFADDDLYLAVAEAMLGYRPDVHSDDPVIKKKAKLERAIFKTVVLALAYSMGARKLRDRLSIALHKEIMAGLVPPPTYEYARELYDKFFEVHEAVKRYQEECAAFADPSSKRKIWDDFVGGEVTWVTAVCGRKRFFPPDTRNAATEAPNVSPQGGSATIAKAAMVLLREEIRDGGWDARPFNAVHDELVYEVRADQAVAFARVLKAKMEEAANFYCPDVPMKASFPEGSFGVVRWWAKEIETDELEIMAAACANAEVSTAELLHIGRPDLYPAPEVALAA